VSDIPYLFEVSNADKGKDLTNKGLGDMLVGLNYNLIKFENSNYLSIQLLNVLPLYTNNDAATALGLDEYDSEVNLKYFGNLTTKTYFSTEIGNIQGK
jgi:hypothetical protein